MSQNNNCLICRKDLSESCLLCDFFNDEPNPIGPINQCHEKVSCFHRKDHCFHRHCINNWVQYRPICPVDGMQWRERTSDLSSCDISAIQIASDLNSLLVAVNSDLSDEMWEKINSYIPCDPKLGPRTMFISHQSGVKSSNNQPVIHLSRAMKEALAKAFWGYLPSEVLSQLQSK